MENVELKMSLYEFAKLINKSNEWDMNLFPMIMRYNNWIDESDTEFGICSDHAGNRLEFNENGKAFLIKNLNPDFILSPPVAGIIEEEF